VPDILHTQASAKMPLAWSMALAECQTYQVSDLPPYFSYTLQGVAKND
jgi:hypothetical protein